MLKKKLTIITILSIAALSGSYFVVANYGYFSGGTNAPSVPEDTMTRGLVGYWSFDCGTGQTVYDGSGNSNNGTFGASSAVGSDDPLWITNGKNAGGAKFDGTNDYVNVGPLTDEITGANPRTISFWFNTDVFGTDTDRTLLTYANGVSGAGLWVFAENEAISVGFGGHRIITPKTVLSIETWYHVSIVVPSGATQTSDVLVYLDGINQSLSDEVGSAQTLDTTDTGVKIGSDEALANYFKGLIDEVRIYNRALSADEIRYHYNRGEPIAYWNFNEGSGTTTYDAMENDNNGTIYGATGTADSGTTTTLTDAKSWTADEWIGETVTIHTGTCSTVSRTITDNDANSITVSDWDSCTPDATSQYKITSEDEWTTGKYGSAIDFDGVDDYVDVGDITVEGTDLTISAWIFVNEIDNDQRSIITKFDLDLDKRAFMFEVDLGGSIRFYTFDATTTTCKKTATGVISTGTWHNVVVVYDYSANDADIYVDNVLKANSQNDDVLHKIPNIATHVVIGGRACGGDDMNGSIDDVRIYNYARTADEIRLDYNAGLATHLGPIGKTCSEDPASCVDYDLVGYWNMDEGSGLTAYDGSDNSNNGTLTGGPKWTTDSAPLQGGSGGGSALKFDGVNDYVDIVDSPELDNTTTMSWSFWIKSNDVVTSDLGMVTKYEAVNGERSWVIRNRYVAGEIGVGISSDGIAYEFKGSTSFGLQIGVITHVVVTYDSGTVTWYKDGVFVETAENTQTSIFAGSHNVEIGKYRTNYFNGLIDEVRIYDRALSIEEIRYLYNKGGPVAQWNFDEGSGQIANDSMGSADGELGSTSGADANDPGWSVP